MNCLKIFNKCKPCFSKISNRYISFSSSIKPTWGNTTPFKPPINSGFVIKVYDGDTITVATKLPYNTSPMYRWSVRIRGIDCPELRTKDPDEKAVAKMAKKFLTDKILNQNVDLKNVDTDKYGRVLADVFHKNENVSELLITKRLAVPYYGKTKKKPVSWLEYYNGKNVKSDEETFEVV